MTLWLQGVSRWTKIIFRLLITFQPGGASERTRVLQSITDGKCGDGVSDILEWVWVWRRNVTRAMELGISIPDPMVLSGALQKATDGLSMKSPQVAYRLNMVRQQLGVDVKPTFQAIWGFCCQSPPNPTQLSLQNKGGTPPLKVWSLSIFPCVSARLQTIFPVGQPYKATASHQLR